MLTAREKVAALRSKRLAQAGLETQLTEVPGVADHQQDFRTPTKTTPLKAVDQAQKISGGSAASTPAGKIPTPTRRRFRNDPRAMRVLWRQYQLRHARKVAVQNAVNSDAYVFMTAAVPDEEKVPVIVKVDSSPSQPTSNSNGEQVHGLNNVDDDDDDDDDDEDGDYNIEDGGGDDEQDEEERALQSAQQQDFQHDETSTLDAHDLSASHELIDKDYQDTRDEEKTTTGDRVCRGLSDDNAMTVSSAPVGTEDREQNVPNQQSSNPKVSEQSSVPKINFVEDSVLEDSAEPVDEKNLDGTAGSISPLSACPFIDQEADEDTEMNGMEAENNDPQNHSEENIESLYSEDDEDAIVPDERPSKTDAVAIANFHRQWEMQQEQDQVAAVAAGTKRRLVSDFDEAVDLTGIEDVKKQSKTIETCKSDVGDGATSEGGENVNSKDSNGAAKKDSTAEYLEAMFRRDDSVSRVIDDEVNEEDEMEGVNNKREQQRALWRARLKNKQRIGNEDENSLSHFDLFMIGAKNRHEDIRKKIESACRSGTASLLIEEEKQQRTKGLKRLPTERGETHEWLEQKESLERRQQKRQRAISVAKWSFEARKECSKPQPKNFKGSSKPNTHVSLGASHLIRKNRSAGSSYATAVVKSTNNVNTKPSIRDRRSKSPTSFKGLLSILGQQAQADV